MNAVKSGTVPVRLRHHEIQLGLISSREFPQHFIFPKGHVDKNESCEKAALRETREESGWAGKIISDPICINKSFKIAVGPRIYIAYFPLLVSKIYKDWPEQKYRSRIWLSLDAVSDIKCDRATKNVLAELHSRYGKSLTRLVRHQDTSA